MDAIEPFLSLLPAFIALVTFIAWIVRMEMAVRSNARDITRLEHRMSQERADMKDDLSEVKDMLAEQNRDIKILLGRGHIQHWNDKTQPPGWTNGV